MNDICCINQFCPTAKSEGNNTAEIVISWVMLLSRDRLNLKDGFREKGGLVLFAVRESVLLCWKSHVNENTILAGSLCWNPFSTVPRISCTFTQFVLLFFHLLLWLWKISSDGADYTPYPTWHFLPPLFLPLLPLLTHLSVSTSNVWSSIKVQRLSQFVSNFLVIVSFLYSLFT